LSLPWTLALLAVGVALAAVSRWQEVKPRELGQPRLFPSTLVLAVGVLLTVVAAAHLVSLLTGTPLHGRFMP
jgi:uncharacterized membrane protein YidH (DUF202 family)